MILQEGISWNHVGKEMGFIPVILTPSWLCNCMLWKIQVFESLPNLLPQMTLAPNEEVELYTLASLEAMSLLRGT